MQNYQIQSIHARRLNPLTPKTQDLISNSPYYLPYSSCDVSLENLALDQLTISLQIFFFILITCLFAILLILLGEIGVKGLRINKRPQKEVDKTENTYILNMAKVEVYISPDKLIPAGPILLLICFFIKRHSHLMQFTERMKIQIFLKATNCKYLVTLRARLILKTYFPFKEPFTTLIS